MTNLTFWRGVCGCTVGSWSAVIAILYCIVAPPLSGAPVVARVAASVSIVLAAALTAKVIALLTARVFILALEG
jgi:hypothetical protein